MPKYAIPKEAYYASGVATALMSDMLWRSWSGNVAFQVGESPLAFIEHHHWGLISLITGRIIKRYIAVFDGFGLTMIAMESAQANPFGVEKAAWHVTANLTLSSILSGLLLFTLAI